MKRMKRWLSMALTLCMMWTMLPAPVLSEEATADEAVTASAPPTSAATATPTATATDTPTAASNADTQSTGTAAVTATPAAGAEAQPTATPTPDMAATATPTSGVEVTATPTPSAEATATPDTEPQPTVTATPGAEAIATPIPGAEATATPAPDAEVTATPTLEPTPGARLIVSFEAAVAPEDVNVPLGTMEAEIGLPGVLQAAFADGSTGDVPVSWVCAQGYDPEAEVGTVYTFAAEVPEGYALAGGLAAPTALVTLIPPAGNGILLASESGWTLNGYTLTITGSVDGSTQAFQDAASSVSPLTIEIESGGILLNASIDDPTCTVNVSSGGSVQGGSFSVGMFYNGSGGQVENCTISMSSYGYITGSNSTYRGCTLKAPYGIMANATFENCQINGIISSFDTSTYKNCAFESVTVEAGFGGTIEVKMDVVIGETTNGDVIFHYGANILNSLAEKYPSADLTNRMWTVGGTAVAADAVFGLQKQTFVAAPSYSEADGVLTIAGPAKLTKEMLADTVKIVVASGGEITGAEDTVSGKTIEIQSGGKISGGDFSGGTVTNSGTIVNGTFSGSVTNNNGGGISGGNFTSATVTNNGTISGGQFANFELSNGVLTVTGTVDLQDGDDELLGVGLNDLTSITINNSASFHAGTTEIGCQVTNRGTITGGTYNNAVDNKGGNISGGTFNGNVPNGNYGKIQGGTFTGMVSGYSGSRIDGGTFTGTVSWNGTIAGGKFTGSVTGNENGRIEEGDFTEGTVDFGNGLEATGGSFNGFKFEENAEDGYEVTISGEINLSGGVPSNVTSKLNKVVIEKGGKFTGGTCGDGVSVENSGTIVNGTFNGSVTNNGTITNGTFNGSVTNNNGGTISGGNFTSATVTNNGTIVNGTFNGSVTNNGTITSGTFNGSVTNNNAGTISGGNFTSATVTNDGTISGGQFVNFELSNRVLTVTGTVDLQSNPGALLGVSLNDLTSITINSSASFHAGETKISCPVTDNGTIKGGTFTGSVTGNENGRIEDGDFTQATVNFGSGLTATGGDFNGFEFEGNAESGYEVTINGEINLWGGMPSNVTSNLNKVVIEQGGKLNGGTCGDGVSVENNGTITGGMFTGSVINNSGGEISGGVFTNATVTNQGSLTGGQFPHFSIRSGYLEITQNVDLTDGEDEMLGIELSDLSSFGANYLIRVGNGVSLTLSAEDAVSNLANLGTVTGGIYQAVVDNFGTISEAKFSGSAFYVGEEDSQLTESEFAGDAYILYNHGTITGCTFGEKTYVAQTPAGTIEVTMSVNGQDQTFQYGDKILEKLGTTSGGWYIQNSGGEWTSVDEQATFGLPKRSFVSGDKILPAPTAAIHYGEETVTVTLPSLDSSVAQGEIDLVFALGDKTYTVENAFAQGGSYTMKLSDLGAALGTALPASAGSEAAEVKISLALDGMNALAQALTVPARPIYSNIGNLTFSNGYNYAQLSAEDMGLLQEYELGLAVENDDLPSEPTYISDANGRISDLAEDTAYVVYTRLKATENSFCSAWYCDRDARTFTQAATHLTVSAATPVYQWFPGMNLPYFNIRPVFSEVGGSGRWDFDDQYTLKITDADGNEVRYIRNAGEYNVSVELDENVGNYALDKDSFTIMVNPIDLSTAQISLPAGAQSPTYTGQRAWPDVDELRVKVGNSTYTLSAADYWQFETAGGKNDVNAGDACVLVGAKSGQSNVVGSGELAYSIAHQTAKLDVFSTSRTWAEDMSLTETALRALFTVNDASGAPLDGSLYTVAVKLNDQTVTPPIVNAGAYTIEVTLTGRGENYALNQNSFAYTISPAAFAGTVSMAGYVYGGTVSTPVLNGYAGGGEATFHYRAKGTAEWMEWKDITATSLVPGSYEIMARVAGTTNYNGGETQVAEFTVSHAALGVSIAMPDYAYGGTVPTPALTPATEGLTVQWYYKGADGVERAWQNITGTTLAAGGYTIIARVERSALYEAAELTASFTVRKAAAPAIGWPTASGITYGQRVSEAALSATMDGHGTFAWAQPDAVLNAGAQSAALTYTPNDTANYDYSGVELMKQIAIAVSAKGLESSGISVVDIPDQTYTGEAIEPEIVVKDGGKALEEGTDYEVTYENNVNAGTVTVTITGKGNYAGEITTAFEIVEREINEDEGFTIEDIPDQTYTGGEIEPEIVVKYGGKALEEGTDYEVTYENNVNAGTVTVIITGKGNYAGEITTAFEIVEREINEDEGFTIEEIPDQTYTGGEIEPEIVVKYGDKTLTRGVDYEVRYEEKVDVGTVTVIITGKGNYSGETSATFEIVPAEAPEIGWPEISAITYGQSLEDALSEMADEHGTFAWSSAGLVPNAGEHLFTLTYTPNDAQNYDYTDVALECEMTVTVEPKDVSELTADAIPEQTYTGSALTPEVTLRDGGKALTAGTDYTVAYADNVNAGTATVTITGMGNYTGTLTVIFAIRAAATEDEPEDKDEQENTQEDPTLTPAQQAKALAKGEAVEGLVTDRRGEPVGYEAASEEAADEATGEIIERTLIIAADPVLDEDGEIVLRDGEPVYEQRNLNLSQALLEAIAELGYTYIRFSVKEAALEWAIADMTEDSNIIRLAPMEADELSQREREAIGEAEQLSGSYRARITAMIDGEETDITSQIPSLTARFDAEAIRELMETELPQCLLVPSDEALEAMVSQAKHVEEGEKDEKESSYQTALAESGLFVLVLQ